MVTDVAFIVVHVMELLPLLVKVHVGAGAGAGAGGGVVIRTTVVQVTEPPAPVATSLYVSSIVGIAHEPPATGVAFAPSIVTDVALVVVQVMVLLPLFVNVQVGGGVVGGGSVGTAVPARSASTTGP
jgi:hypothetical protein